MEAPAGAGSTGRRVSAPARGTCYCGVGNLGLKERMMRFRIFAVFLCAGAAGFSQSPASSAAPPMPQHGSTLGSTLSKNWWGTVPGVQGETGSWLDARRGPLTKHTFVFDPRIAPELIARNAEPDSPLRVIPHAQAEPIPTQWPNLKNERIPTEWPKLKLQPVDGSARRAPVK
jgi:hypothetical protein